jgi:hypothetical protein
VSFLHHVGFDRHLSEADLAAVWADAKTDGAPEGPLQSHLQACADCRAQYAAFTGWLEAAGADARAEADEAFPADRLAAQHTHVLRRLEALGRPARILAFPKFAGPISANHGTGQRWIASAAAAGLIVGLAVGNLVDFRPAVTEPRTPQVAVRTTAERGGIQPANLSVSDETLLYDAEFSSSAARVPEVLRPIHDITPGGRDFEPR